MEITGKAPLPAPQPQARFYDDAQDGTVSQPDNPHDKDTVELSSNANEIKEMVRKIKDLPDVRAEKVAALKHRIESGTYAILKEKAASQLIGETVENNAILNRIDTLKD
jgi:flagellar biosynthesis anti-sigma factor FlgM